MLDLTVDSLRSGRRVLSGKLTLSVPKGEIHLLRGPNGCGKSLLFDAITGVHHDNGVALTVDKRRAQHASSYHRWQLGVRRLFQGPRLPGTLSLQVLLDRIRNNTANDPNWCKCLIDAYTASGIPFTGLVGDLSFGQKRFAELALTISSGRIHLLDEPFAGFSTLLQKSAEYLIKAAALQGAALLITDHLNNADGLRFDYVHNWVFPEQSRINGDASKTDWDEFLGKIHAEKLEGYWNWTVPELSIGDRVVLHDCGFRLRAGEMLLLTGANGSGKSTVLRALAKLAQPWPGVQAKVSVSAEIQDIFVSPQPPKLVGDISVEENLDLMVQSQRPRLAVAHRLLGVFGFESRVLAQMAESLSGGESAIVAAIGAVLSPRRVVFLDEPFESLAPHTRTAIASLIRASLARGKCAIIATHELVSEDLFPHERRVGLDHRHWVTTKDFGRFV